MLDRSSSQSLQVVAFPKEVMQLDNGLVTVLQVIVCAYLLRRFGQGIMTLLSGNGIGTGFVVAHVVED